MQRPIEEISEPHCCQFIATFLEGKGLARKSDESGPKGSTAERIKFLREGVIIHHAESGLCFHVTELVMRATTEIEFSKADGTPLKTIKTNVDPNVHIMGKEHSNVKRTSNVDVAKVDMSKDAGAAVHDSDEYYSDADSIQTYPTEAMLRMAEDLEDEHATKREEARARKENIRKELLSPSALLKSDIFDQFELFSGYKLSFSKDGWGMIVKNGKEQSRIVCFEGAQAPKNELYKKRYALIQVNKFPNFGKKGKYVHCMNAILEYSSTFREEKGKILLDCGPSQINSPEYELLNSTVECLKSVIEECEPTN